MNHNIKPSAPAIGDHRNDDVSIPYRFSTASAPTSPVTVRSSSQLSAPLSPVSPMPYTSAGDSTPTFSAAPSSPTQVSLTSLLRSVSATVAERGRSYAGRQTRRIILKDGTCNVASRNVTDRKRRYLADLFTTLIDLRWRWHVVMFALAFVVSWTFFAVIWWTIAAANGDLGFQRKVATSDASGVNSSEHCIANVDDFRTALLFSIETQTTIGYGLRNTEPHCVSGIVVMMLQACVGVFIQCLITGIVFSKLSRPKSRAQTLLFSRYAAISLRDGAYCLQFRVGDVRGRSHIVGTALRAVLVRNRLTREGESIPLCQYPISVQTSEDATADLSSESSTTAVGLGAEAPTEKAVIGNGNEATTSVTSGDQYLFLVWPVTIVHRIDERSPFWDVSAEQLLADRFELIVILEGTVETNGKFTQVRTSYLPSEILWGHRLTQLVTRVKSSTVGHYDIDFRQFHDTTPVAMPEYSAKVYQSVRKQRLQQQQQQQQQQQSIPASRELGDKQHNESNKNGSRMTSAGKADIADDKSDLERAGANVEPALETPSLTRHIYRRRIEVRSISGQSQPSTSAGQSTDPPTAD